MDYTKYTDSINISTEKHELALIPERKPKIFLTMKQCDAYNDAIEYLKFYRTVTEACPMNQKVYKYFLFGLSDILEDVYPDEYNGLASISVSNLNKFFDEKDISFHVDVNDERPFGPTFKVIRWVTWKELV